MTGSVVQSLKAKVIMAVEKFRRVPRCLEWLGDQGVHNLIVANTEIDKPLDTEWDTIWRSSVFAQQLGITPSPGDE